MSRYIDVDALIDRLNTDEYGMRLPKAVVGLTKVLLDDAPTIDIVRCENCRKSHIDGKTTHYLWCTEWGRSTDTFGYCERGKREGE